MPIDDRVNPDLKRKRASAIASHLTQVFHVSFESSCACVRDNGMGTVPVERVDFLATHG